MNRIRVVEDKIVEQKINKKVSIDLKPSMSEFDITAITLSCLKSCDIELDLSFLSKKIKLNILVNRDADINLYLYQRIEDSKVQYNYEIKENANINVYKFQEVAVGKEMMEVHLLENGATINYYLKDICKQKETMDYYIYHDSKNTVSNIKNNIVSAREGIATIQVSTFVPKGMNGCIANQNNRIISLNEKKNEIRPNLYIDEFDVVANHSALIGKFSGDEIFYLQSRGISKMEATRLLLKGFLLSDIPLKKMQKEIEKATKKEWR